MKKETRYEMLSNIDRKYIDEAYPKKRNPATIIIPAIACALALIAPSVIAVLRTSPAVFDAGTNNDPLLQNITQEQEYTQNSTTKNQITDPEEPHIEQEKPPTSETDIIVAIPPGGAASYPLSGKALFLSGYSSLNLNTASHAVGDLALLYKPDPDSSDYQIIESWHEVTEYYGKDLSPSFLPYGLKKPSESGKSQSWGRFTARFENGRTQTIDKVQMYYFPTYYSDTVGPDFDFDTDFDFSRYVHVNVDSYDLFSPVNRGVYIVASSTEYTDVRDTLRYKTTVNAEEGLSYYHGTPILFYRETDDVMLSCISGSTAIKEACDYHTSEMYITLLDDFLDLRPELRNAPWTDEDRSEWNAVLHEFDVPAEDPITYRAIFVYEGVKYELYSNLDFENFAAIAASLIHD